MGGSGGLERTEFEQFLLSEGVVVLKELFLISEGVVVLKGLISEQFLLSEGVMVGSGDVEVLKELILNSFYFGRVWWS